MDANYLKLMAGGDVLLLSKKIVDQAWDKYRVGRKLGGQDELMQTVAETLLQVRTGKVVIDLARGVSFMGFVLDKARWTAKKNWMLEAPQIKRPEPAQPVTPSDTGEEEGREGVDDDKKIEPQTFQTVTTRAGGSDAQSESDIKLDEPAAWALGFLDDFDGDDSYDLYLTPAHSLLKYAGTSTLADLLDCTPRTICNMLSHASERQEIAKKTAASKIYLKK